MPPIFTFYMDQENLFNFVYNRYNVWEYENFNEVHFPREENCKVIDINEIPIRAVHENEIKHPRWTLKDGKNVLHPTYGSADEQKYREHYSNPCSTTRHERYTIVVTKTEEKVAIKILFYQRDRRCGKPYFKVQTSINYLTYNFKTHSLYIGSIFNYHKKRKNIKKIRRNEFWSDPFAKIMSMVSNVLSRYITYNPERAYDKSIMIDQIINNFFSSIPGSEKYEEYPHGARLFKLRADGVGIKCPNNWQKFVNIYPLPTLKLLRKKKMKLIDSIMEIKRLSGDKIKRVLHNVERIGDLSMYKFAISFFGEDFILGQSDEFLKKLIENLAYHTTTDNENQMFSKQEKKNIFKIFQIVVDGKIMFHTFMDHLIMYRKISDYEEIKWKSTTYDEFNDEHIQYTERVDFYTKGQFQRNYNDEFKSMIEKPIVVNSETYYPVVLCSSYDYNMESFFQSNCVKTYGNRVDSIIISLRKDNEHIGERATIQFLLNKKQSGEVYAERLQTLGRFNKNLTPDWDPAVQMLEQKFKSYINKDNYKIYNLIYKVGFNEYISEIEFEQNKDWYYLEFTNKEVFGGTEDPLLMPMEIVHINEPEF